MRLLPVIIFLSSIIFFYSCNRPIRQNFLKEVNNVLIKDRDVSKMDLSFEKIDCESKMEEQILDVVKSVKETKLLSKTQNNLEKDTERILLAADSQANQVGYPSLVLWTKAQIGFYYYRMAELEKALPYFVEASKYLDNPNFEPTIDPVDCLIKSAYFLGNIGDHQLAIDNLKKALTSRPLGGKDTANIYYSLGFEYNSLKNTDDAKKYFQLANARSIHRDPLRYARVLGELALLEIEAGNKENAEKLLLEDIEISDLFDDERNGMFARIRLSQLYVELQRWDEAKLELAKAQQYVDSKVNLLGFQQEILLANLKIYQHFGDRDKQLETYQKLRDTEERLKHTDGADPVMNVKISLLRERSDWDRLLQEGKLQKSNILGGALLIICTLLLVLAISLRMSKLKSLKLQQSEFEYKITAIELDKFKSDSRYQQAQQTIQSYLTFIDERNAAIDHLKEEVAKLENATSTASLEQRLKLKDMLTEHLMSEDNWYRFKRIFITEYPQFYDQVIDQLEDITESQLRIVLLQKVGVNNHEMANLLGVGMESIKKAKQRLRKKYGEAYEKCFSV